MTDVRSMRAHAVSRVVGERLPHTPTSAVVLARSRSAIHIDANGLVLTLLDRRVPLAPNSIMVPELLERQGLPSAGDPALVGAGLVRVGDLEVTWDAAEPPEWEPRVAGVPPLEPQEAAAWATRILRRLALPEMRSSEIAAERLFGADLDARIGVLALLGSIRRRDPGSTRGAARLLTGRGPGLTPAGDDLLAGAAVAVASAGAALGLAHERSRAWRRAAIVPDLSDRTTALSATLLRLAAEGMAPEPLHGVLHGAGAPDRGLRSLDRLLDIGASTGWATAAGAALSMRELAAAALAAPGSNRWERA